MEDEAITFYYFYAHNGDVNNLTRRVVIIDEEVSRDWCDAFVWEFPANIRWGVYKHTLKVCEDQRAEYESYALWKMKS